MRRTPTDPLSKQFALLIRDELERQQVSISELARRIGTTHQTVSKTINHPGAVTTRTMLRYFEALGVQPRLTINADVTVG